MSATPLLFMNSLCQMLDTACASRVLLKNGPICMTKAHGFSVAGREGCWVWRGKKAGDRRGLLDGCIGIVGSFQSRRSETLLDMINTDSEVLDEEPGLDLSLTVSHIWVLFPYFSKKKLYAVLESRRDSTTDESNDEWGQNTFQNV